MIIFGSRAVHIKSGQLKEVTCPSCGTKGSVVLNIYRRHAHVFWIPVFPMGKKGATQCQHCKNVLRPNEMPEEIKREFDIFKREAKGPVWQFFGLGVIVALAVLISILGERDKKKEVEYIKAPKKGDVYEYKIKARSYSTFKVIGVSNDSVFVVPNEYEINRISKIYKIKKTENYSNNSYGIARDKLNEMHTSGDIINIDRDN